MAENRFLEFLDPVTSPGIIASRAPFFRPGRFGGYDNWVPFPAGSGLRVKVFHDKDAIPITRGPANQTDPYGVLVTPQGLVHLNYMEDSDGGIPVSLPINTGADNKVFLFYSRYTWQENAAGGSQIEYGFRDITSYADTHLRFPREGYVTAGTTFVQDWVPLLEYPVTDSPIGVFVIEPGNNEDYTKVFYHMSVPPSVGNLPHWLSAPVALLDADQTFTGVNIFNNLVIDGGYIYLKDFPEIHCRLFTSGTTNQWQHLLIGLTRTESGKGFRGISMTRHEVTDKVSVTLSADFAFLGLQTDYTDPYSLVPKSYVDALKKFGAWTQVGSPGLGYSNYFELDPSKRPLSIRLSNDHIEIVGWIRATMNFVSPPVFTLPVQYRPAYDYYGFVRSGQSDTPIPYIVEASTGDVSIVLNVTINDTFGVYAMIPRL
jgi:hypothetical protein